MHDLWTSEMLSYPGIFKILKLPYPNYWLRCILEAFSHLCAILSQPYQSDFWTSVSPFVTFLSLILLIASIKNKAVPFKVVSTFLLVLFATPRNTKLLLAAVQDDIHVPARHFTKQHSASDFYLNSYIGKLCLKQERCSYNINTDFQLASPSKLAAPKTWTEFLYSSHMGLCHTSPRRALPQHFLQWSLFSSFCSVATPKLLKARHSAQLLLDFPWILSERTTTVP